MKSEEIRYLIESGSLRIRQIDYERIKSMIDSAEITVKVAKKILIDEESATLIFREIYESIRQLGEAKWWLNGYEPQGVGSHGVSLDILNELNIKEKIRLNNLERFKKIRNDSNYRGFRVTVFQAKEILEFWDKCGIEIIKILRSELKNFLEQFKKESKR